MPTDLSPLWITLKLAAATTAILYVVGAPIALWLATTRSRARPVVEAVTALPLVLPPTVIGFYLLILLNPHSPFGAFWSRLTGGSLTFSFAGLVVASIVYSLPFMVQPLQRAFETVGRAPMEAAASLRAGPVDAFFTVLVPAARRGALTAGVLTFAHTVGEFGVVLMVGGAIPDRTKVISIAVYEHVEALRYDEAHLWSAWLLGFSFIVLTIVYALDRAARLRVG
ncbi:MAG: molybdate ABC transporter permease subunit [Parvularculaceae bacterium]